MEVNDVRDSPYITSWGLVPPSPTRSIEFDHTSPFESAFGITDNNIQGGHPLTPPTYTNTSSYHGSYYNSPFSQHSELVELDFLQDLPSGSTATSGANDYEPSEYDAPNQGGSLLMFPTDPDFMSPHFSPNNIADGQRARGSPFDHGSPVSSPGLDDNNLGGRHSRASSVASNQPSHSPHRPCSHSPQPSFQHSPRLDVLNSFGNMSVHTPHWGSQPLPNPPSPHIGTESLSQQQQQKAQSPPRLAMPPGMTFSPEPTAVPKINAPDSKEGNSLMFNIVPATPVSGGDAGVQRNHFQQSLTPLIQGKFSFLISIISWYNFSSQGYNLSHLMPTRILNSISKLSSRHRSMPHLLRHPMLYPTNFQLVITCSQTHRVVTLMLGKKVLL